jgi:UDP-N-acetylmuramoyl-L-alanyl-D-glutamate--2,6-diaminopimelate ligase
LASLADLLRSLGVPTEASWHGVDVAGITEDSRVVRRGDLFVAVPGGRRDGADYATEAVSRGAVAVVSERPCGVDAPNPIVDDARRALAVLSAEFQGNPSRALFTVGVTGTDGKTTVCHLAAHLLGGEATALISTVTNERRGLRAVTTPASPIVQSIARDAVHEGRRNLVIEASSIGLAQHRLDAIDFDAAVFTNLTRDHYDAHGSREAYLEAKAHLFRGLNAEAWAIVNADDAACAEILDRSNGRPLTYTIEGDADLSAEEVRTDLRGTRFRLRWRDCWFDVALPLPGRHNVENALAALGAGLCAGVPMSDLVERLRSARPVAGRSEFFERANGPTVVVDFAHTPDALARTLEWLRSEYLRVVVVFGCPGDSDRGKRELMGEVAGRTADLAVITADNPKHEDARSIGEAIARGVARGVGRAELILDRADAIRFAVSDARPGDVVLVAGKGHETYQIVGDRFLPYSDADVLVELGFAPSAGDSD